MIAVKNLVNGRDEANLTEDLKLIYWNLIQVFGYSVKNSYTNPENTRYFWSLVDDIVSSQSRAVPFGFVL
jgi:hypothetical protein